MAIGKIARTSRRVSATCGARCVDPLVLFKWASLGLLLLYILVDHFSLRATAARTVNTLLMARKAPFAGSHCLTVLGGSNARQGISARILSTDGCSATNLGISGELGGFRRYLDWLEQEGVRSRVVLYSSLLLWSDGEDSLGDAEAFGTPWYPAEALVTVIRRRLTPEVAVPSEPYDPFGDQLRYQCARFFDHFKLNVRRFPDINDSVVHIAARRVDLIRKTTHASRVMLIVPSVFMTAKDSAQVAPLLAVRIAGLRARGLVVLDTRWISTAREDYCDNIHLNSGGRAMHSHQIKQQLNRWNAPTE
jgi:hypothetical protein